MPALRVCPTPTCPTLTLNMWDNGGMPKAGYRAASCVHGHDLTAPNARLPATRNQRGGGNCRACHLESQRRLRKSTKVGPPSNYIGDEWARRAALAAGKKRCPHCGVAKDHADYSKTRSSPDGLNCYCRSCRKAMKAEAYRRDRENILVRKQANSSGLTVAAVRAMIESQGGLCAICRRVCISGRALAVDHCHTTNRVRGLLCANCNRGLGLFKDSTESLAAAIRYLSADG